MRCLDVAIKWARRRLNRRRGGHYRSPVFAKIIAQLLNTVQMSSSIGCCCCSKEVSYHFDHPAIEVNVAADLLKGGCEKFQLRKKRCCIFFVSRDGLPDLSVLPRSVTQKSVVRPNI